ncbi:MAG TPA: nitroreductase family protein [Bryobacteraceae bacterium]|nr:nitroreductase family protein [Bryobacteraceae bacterium]HOQ44390.1 nitroreductase family protein [Bryobacteraceae bacterium]HPQ16148.1 nitroreductase family protein [Bryobacteraceae bacterium]HPU70709.1 nitroreductase family protein [Bryobacteraceae bacterium]
MDFFDVLQSRRSIRNFANRPVEQDKVRAVLEAANSAPSAGNLQAYEIYLATRKEDRTMLARAALEQWFIAEAPIALVFCTNPERARRYGKRGAERYALQDATIACTFAMLAATALGLSTVWVGAFDDDSVRRIIKAPSTETPVAILPIGYPAESPEKTPRRPLADLVHEV